jgi:hypothetical protein
MRAREMMVRLDRLPNKRKDERKTWDLSLLSPEKQDRAVELLRLIVESKDIQSNDLDTALAELDGLVGNLPLLGSTDPEQGPLIEVPGALAGHWQWHQPPSKWPRCDFSKLTKVQTVRFNALCERYGFRRGGNPYKAQMPPLHTWRPKDRVEIQRLLDKAAECPSPWSGSAERVLVL